MTDRRKIKQLVKIWIAVGVVLIILGYGGFRAKNIAEGPHIEVFSPQNGSVLGESLATIEGSVQNISFLTLNGNKIFTDETGNFSEHILLSNGYNILTLRAEDRFGRAITKTLELTYK